MIQYLRKLFGNTPPPPKASPPLAWRNDAKVEITEVFRGPWVNWIQEGCGFGQLSVSYNQKLDRIEVWNECMGREWVRKALHSFADYVADNGVLMEVADHDSAHEPKPQSDDGRSTGGT